MDKIQSYSETIYESIKHTDELVQDFWYVRELQQALEYTE